MTRQRIIACLCELAISLGPSAEGTEWHLFGSVDRNERNPSDIDLMILCIDDAQADFLRQSIDPDGLPLPLHLALLTFDEASEINAVRVQQSSVIYPNR